jgi:signal peptidase I
MVMVAAMVVGAAVLAPRVHRIEGHSMHPALRNDDRTIFVRPLSTIRRADIVAYRYPVNPAKTFSGRVVGLPGERLAIVEGVVHVDGRPLDEPYLAGVPRSSETVAEVRLGPDDFYVLGDNRRNSSDSREWGPVAGRLIRKRFAFVWWRNAGRGFRLPAPDRPSR